MTAIEKVRQFYQQFSGDDRVLIVINADPDAIAGSMAVKRLLWRKVKQVETARINVIKRPDNLTMLRVLGTKITHINRINADDFNRFVIIDSQPDHHELFSRFRFDVIIDHHPVTGNHEAFCDIRPEYGAVSTIMTQYLKAAKIKPSVKLATALFHAVKIDTNNFERQTTMEDIQAFQFLYKHADTHLSQRIEQADILPGFLKYFTKAIDEKVFKKGRMFTHLGKVVNPDVCVLIADFFMRISSVRWSIASGIYNKRMIIIFRNDGNHRNVGQTVKKLFGRIGNAGGRKSMGRVEIKTEALKDIDLKNDKDVLKWLIKQVET